MNNKPNTNLILIFAIILLVILISLVCYKIFVRGREIEIGNAYDVLEQAQKSHAKYEEHSKKSQEIRDLLDKLDSLQN